MDSIESRAVFDYIRYANCWEDTAILYRALAPGKNKRILSVASAGDNSFALLAEGAEVIAVDLSPVQLACVELRRAAMRRLDYENVLAFFGIHAVANRQEIYLKLRPDLTSEAAGFWDSQSDVIQRGIIHGGKFERYFTLFRKRVLPLLHSQRTIATLLEEKDRAGRTAFYHETWANWRWFLLFKIFFSRFLMARLGRDPEFFRYVKRPVSTSILARAEYALTELPTHDNPYLEYILTGNFSRSLPYYLRPDMYKKIFPNLDKLILFKGSVQDAAQACRKSGFDGFNLSDIFEYIDSDTCRTIYGLLLECANPGARFAYWNMLVPLRCSTFFPERACYLEALSHELFRQDQAFFYSDFIVEEVL